jgi:RNA polymerase sigma-70 factor, ECF subfamily
MNTMTREQMGAECQRVRDQVIGYLASHGYRENAEDIFQDACLRALTSRAGFGGHSRFGTWLTRVAINCARMRWRADRAECRNVELTVSLQDANPQHFATPERYVAAKETAEALMRKTHLIPRSQRYVVLLLAAGYHYHEIAAVRGVSYSAVKAFTSRARSNLSRILKSRPN